MQLVLFSAIGVGLVWLSIHNIPDADIETTKQSFKEADYFISRVQKNLKILQSEQKVNARIYNKSIS